MAMGMSLIECTEVQCYCDRCPHLFEGPELMQQSMWQDDLIEFAKLLMHVLTRCTLPLAHSLGANLISLMCLEVL